MPGQNVTGSHCYSMAQGGQWVWEVTETYCCGEEANVPGEELCSTDQHQKQTKGKTNKACSMASKLVLLTRSSMTQGRPFKPAVYCITADVISTQQQLSKADR